MPLIGSVGVGRETIHKQEDFAYISGLHLVITRAITAKWTGWASPIYHYIDLNAGCGAFDVDVDGEKRMVLGSPALFAEAALRCGMPWRAWLFERDPDSAKQLKAQLELLGSEVCSRAQVFPVDHIEASSHIQTSGRPYGLIYVDPNGSILPVGAVSQLTQLRTFERMDVLAYVAATTYKRVRGAFADEDRPFLVDHLKALGKKHVYLREPAGQHQWTFAFLTNWGGYPAMKSKGLHRIESPVGEKILNQLNLSTREREDKEQPRLCWSD